MGNFSITFAGLVSIIVVLQMLCRHSRNIWKVFTNPLLYICVGFYKNFGSYKTVDFSCFNEILLLVSFLTFLLLYCIGKKASLTRFDRLFLKFPFRKNTSAGLLVTRKGLYIFLSLIVLYCVVDLWVNSLIYGSIERALLRFYSTPILNTTYVSFRNYLSVYYGGMLVLVFVYRYYLNVHIKSSSLFFVGVLLLVLIAIPRGSRGAVMLPIVMLVFADLFAKRYYGINMRKHVIQYVYLGTVGLVLFFTLTTIRSIKYDSFDDLLDVLETTSVSVGAKEYAEREGELMIRDTKLCFETFGNRIPFLPVYYTVASIGVSYIPRSLWAEKPVSFGLVINAIKTHKYSAIGDSERLNYVGAVDWAAGVAGEGWANGGLLGLLLYSMLFGFISGKCSRLYSILILYKNNFIATALALMLFQMSFCFIRGSLQSTFTPALYSFVFVLIVIKMFLKK